MSVEYTMFGYDERHTPVVATNVTADQAKAFAGAKGLTGFFLSAQDPQAPDNPGIVTYELNEAGKYHKVRLRQWVKNNLLDLKDE